MQLIAAVDKNWAIGHKGQMLVAIPADQKWFRQETMGKIIVMGRKTLLTLPGERPLDGRINLILTTDKSFKLKGADVCHSVEEVLNRINGIKKNGDLRMKMFSLSADRVFTSSSFPTVIRRTSLILIMLIRRILIL